MDSLLRDSYLPRSLFFFETSWQGVSISQLLRVWIISLSSPAVARSIKSLSAAWLYICSSAVSLTISLAYRKPVSVLSRTIWLRGSFFTILYSFDSHRSTMTSFTSSTEILRLIGWLPVWTLRSRSSLRWTDSLRISKHTLMSPLSLSILPAAKANPLGCITW